MYKGTLQPTCTVDLTQLHECYSSFSGPDSHAFFTTSFPAQPG